MKFKNINLIYKSDITDNIPELHYDKWWGCHTFDLIVPPDKYFKENPELYSKRCGVRIPNGQLCLTNPELVDIVAKNLIQIIKENPQYDIYDLSQNDNERYCKCKECRKAARKYGQSGVLLNFVNQVARKVKEVYPDKKIGTFAYLYTRHTPKDKSIIPDDNVVIRLCNIECCWNHPLDNRFCCKNKRFMNDYKVWKSICNNVSIWDYSSNFWNILGPFPNLDSLYRNIQIFYENGCEVLLEEGCYTEYGELNELRTTILKKSFENPYHNLNDTIEEFLIDFYGDKADTMKQYIALLRDKPLAFWRRHFKCFYKPWSWFLSKSFLKKSIALLNLENDKTIYADRIDRVFMGIGLTFCWRYPHNKISKQIYPKVKELLIKNNVRSYKESSTYDIDEFFKMMEGNE